ncbi:putative toxin-antitoxin system toxin component, PIN family [candidate division WOR-3 bacterium]|nr:putative toxin-antitoxin system toxin component, PIN family [candidate division WOR-3 bacterium]
MGEREQVRRIALDTGVLVSALLFRSEASALFKAWRDGRFLLAATEPILEEYTRALRYSRFRLTEEEAVGIMEQLVLPFCQRFDTVVGPRYCPNPDGDKFINCALVAQASALVSADRGLLTLASSVARVPIIPVADAVVRFCR